MGAYVGRDVLVEYAIALPSAVKSSLVYVPLGMMRAKDISTDWDTADTTGDKSPLYTKTQLATFKNIEFSGDGVSYDDAVHNQLAFEQQTMNPSSVTGGQPLVWLRVTYPNKVYEGPFMVSNFSNSSPHDGEATWSMTANSNGAVTLTSL